MSDTPLTDASKANRLTIKVDASPGQHAESATYTHRSEGWSASLAAEYGKKMAARPQWKLSADGKIEWEP